MSEAFLFPRGSRSDVGKAAVTLQFLYCAPHLNIWPGFYLSSLEFGHLTIKNRLESKVVGVIHSVSVV